MEEAKALKALAKAKRKRSDPEVAHADADRALVDFVRALGYEKVAAAWEAVKKWYA